MNGGEPPLQGRARGPSRPADDHRRDGSGGQPGRHRGVSHFQRSTRFDDAVLGLQTRAHTDADVSPGVRGRGFLHPIEHRFKSRPGPRAPTGSAALTSRRRPPISTRASGGGIGDPRGAVRRMTQPDMAA